MIKVGDWVKCEGKIGEVVHVYLRENTAWVGVMFSVGCMDDVQKDLLTKLPIKFKGFEIVLSDYGLHDGEFLWSTVRAPKGIGYTCFRCIKAGERFYVSIYNKKLEHSIVSTIDQARDWLELQYAILIDKARGMI